MPVHGTIQFYSKVYGLDEDRPDSYPSQNGQSEEGPGEEEYREAESSNENYLYTSEEATAKEDKSRVQSIRGKSTKDQPSKMNRKRRRGDAMTKSPWSL